MINFEDFSKLQKGEHPLEEIFQMAGLEKADDERDFYLTEDGKCSNCGNFVEITEDESWDEECGFTVFPQAYCKNCERHLDLW